MKKIIITNIFIAFTCFSFGQNISFSIEVDDSNAPATSVVSVYAQADAGTETMSSETIVLYYDDTKATIDVSAVSSPDLDLTPTTATLGWNSAINNVGETLVMAADVPAGFDPGTNKRIQLDLADGDDFVGSTFTTTPTLLAQLTFNSITDDAPIAIGDGVTTDPGSSIYLPSLLVDPTLTPYDVEVVGNQTNVLPIELYGFTATKDQGRNRTILEWTTATEINGSHFEVERSQHGDNWSVVGKVDAVGESSTLQNYSMIDNVPMDTRDATKVFYYRLNMIDNDGSQEYSDIRTVRFNQEGADFIVYPNPSVNEVFVNLSSITEATGPVRLDIFAIDGQKVKDIMLTTNDDIRVDISDIKVGTYLFTVTQGDQRFTKQIIKID